MSLATRLKLNSSIFISLILLLLFSISASQAAVPEMNDSVNITYVGFNDSDSSAIEALMEDYFGSDKDYLNRKPLNHVNSQIFHVNYHYINNSYGISYENSELKMFSNPDTGDILNQDIVIIDMLWVYDNQDLVDNLKAAKKANPNLKLIQIRSDESDPDGIFASQEDERLITLVNSDFNAYDYWTDPMQAYNRGLMLTYEKDWSNPSNPFLKSYPTYEGCWQA
ncbi:MAG: hypothetical protein LBU81_08505 [Methanosarcinales archaeon]|jgi:hypothetical protein|nr:hypothetical protein [Methanosarcinales archaeon]